MTQLSRLVADMKDISGLSLSELSKLSGVDRGLISRIVNGKQSPTHQVVQRLASAMGYKLSVAVEKESKQEEASNGKL